MEQQDLAARQFGAMASRYLVSAVHASGADLDRLACQARTRRPALALDLGCGAGHAGFALARGGAGRVIAYDPARPMLDVVAAEAVARGLRQLETRAGPAERLDFADSSFDMVVTRYSAHHWRDVPAAVRQIARVLKPGATAVVIDVVAPEDPLLDTSLQTVELLRDPAHVRNYRESEWRRMFEAAHLTLAGLHRWKLNLEFDGWVARIGTSAARVAALETVFDDLAEEARRYFDVTAQRAFSIDAAWFEVGLTQDPGRRSHSPSE